MQVPPRSLSPAPRPQAWSAACRAPNERRQRAVRPSDLLPSRSQRRTQRRAEPHQPSGAMGRRGARVARVARAARGARRRRPRTILWAQDCGPLRGLRRGAGSAGYRRARGGSAPPRPRPALPAAPPVAARLRLLSYSVVRSETAQDDRRPAQVLAPPCIGPHAVAPAGLSTCIVQVHGITAAVHE